MWNILVKFSAFFVWNYLPILKILLASWGYNKLRISCSANKKIAYLFAKYLETQQKGHIIALPASSSLQLIR